MKNRYILLLTLLVTSLCFSIDIQAQRRSRPGAMKHTQAEVTDKQKVTKLSCKYICDGSTFEGPIYMTGDAGGIKIGDAVIIFTGGKYMLSFDAQKFKIKKYGTMGEAERRARGITKYEYENSWEYKKIGQDFEYGGKYATIEQYGKKWLMLYNGDSDSVYAKIPLESTGDKSFELDEDDMLVRMTYVQ